MLFPTFTFFLFFAVVLLFNWQLKKWPLLWRLFLLLISYFFYATWNFRFLFLLFTITLANFFFGRLISKEQDEKKRRLVLFAAVAANLLFLGFFKYYDFFRSSFSALLKIFGSSPQFLLLHLILPVGLSFYILRAISYNIDIFRRQLKPTVSLLDFSLYIAFFPQLLSGPIMRPAEFLPQLENGGAKTIENFPEQIALILSGLFKKLVIASYLTTNIVDNVFPVPQNHSALAVLLAIYAYAVVIYCDFSGYSEMAIGIAGLMGFKSPQNFNAPYLALNIQDFWRRWHITLSNWLRDYVYIPLGGNRKGKLRKYLNLLVTMFVSGLWHGTGLHYVIWGLFHGFGLAAQQIIDEKEQQLPAPKTLLIKSIKKFASWFITLHFVCFGWIFFRAESVSDAFLIIKQLFNSSGPAEPLPLYVIYLIPLCFLGFFFGERIKKLFVSVQEKIPFFFQILLVAILVVLILKLGPEIIPPFIYFNF